MSTTTDKEVAVLGVGMHPWGKWGRNFIEYGVDAAQRAIADAGLQWRDIEFVAGADTMRQGYPGYIAGRHVQPGPGLEGQPRCELLRGVCLRSASAQHRAHADPRRLLRSRAGRRRRHQPQGFLRAAGRRPPRRSRLAPVPPARRHQPHLLRAVCPPPHGALRRHRGRLRQGARPRTPSTGWTTRTRGTRRTSPSTRSSRRRWSPTRCGCWRSVRPVTAARPSCSRAWTSHGATPPIPSRVAASPRSRRRYPQTIVEMPDFATDSAVAVAPAGRPFRDAIAAACLRRSRTGPDDLDLAEVYDLSSALELDWYENIGLCPEAMPRGCSTTAHHDRRTDARESQRRARLLRRGRPGPGDRPGVRGRVAVAW